MAMVGLRTHYVLNERNNRGVAVMQCTIFALDLAVNIAYMYTVVEFFVVGLHYIYFEYRTLDIISRSLYIFYPIFHCGL